MSLDGRRVMVTGAGRGLGRAIAAACAAEGAFVGVGYRASEADARALAEELGGVALALDVRDAAQIAEAVAAFGVVDAWVNNAGESRPGLLVGSSPDDARAVLDTNLLGPILCTQAVLPGMLRRRRGVILNIGSVAAERPYRGQAVYAASKGGLEAFTRAVAVEYARKGIRALCLRAGAIDTGMLASTRVLGEDELLARIPQGRVATPEEIGALAAWLLGDRAAYLTGSTISADGGYLVG
jgi:NAD(P)-dependent dehydrogenase (short-subunit alcohol dehydrogenase family)